MNKNIIVIPIEVKVREFIPKLYLSCKIASKSNFQVYFGGQRFLTKSHSPRNCVWFDKLTYIENRLITPFHVNNRVIMQDEEGPISYNHISTVKKRYDCRQKKYLEFFLFSGSADLKMVKFLKLAKQKIKLFGLLKLELLKKKNLKFFEKEVSEIKKKYKNFIFIPGHFSTYRSPNQSKYIYNNQKFSSKSVLNEHKNILKNYYALLKLSKKIAIQNPELTVIFRRHPNEVNENLLNYFGIIPKNLKFIYKYSATPWIIACKYYLHSGCQTSLEAITLRKKIITYMPNKVNHKNFELTKPFFKDQKNCLDFILKEKNKNKIYEIKKQLNKIAINIKKNFSYENEFINFLKTQYNYKMFSRLEEKKYTYQNFFKKKIFRFLSTIKSWLVRNDIYLSFIPQKYYISREIKEKKFYNIKAIEIRKFILTFNKIYNENIKYKKISDSCFIIHK